MTGRAVHLNSLVGPFVRLPSMHTVGNCASLHHWPLSAAGGGVPPDEPGEVCGRKGTMCCQSQEPIEDQSLLNFMAGDFVES